MNCETEVIILSRLKISLKAARANANLSQEDVAIALKKSKNTINNWENGRTEIDLGNLKELCNLYSVTIDDIRLPFSLLLVNNKTKKGAIHMNELKIFTNSIFADTLGYQNGSRDINRHTDEEDRPKANCIREDTLIVKIDASSTLSELNEIVEKADEIRKEHNCNCTLFIKII